MSSMIFGILSVVFATSRQRTMAMLNNHLNIRLWLSRGKPRLIYDYPFRLLPLESSAGTLMSIELPQFFLNLAIFLYLVGFGLYFLFLWVEDANSDVIGNRNTFIVFVIVIGIAAIYIMGLGVGQFFDERRRRNDFDLTDEENFGKSEKHLELDEMLGTLQNIRGLKIPDDQMYQSIEKQMRGNFPQEELLTDLLRAMQKGRDRSQRSNHPQVANIKVSGGLGPLEVTGYGQGTEHQDTT